MQVKKHILTDTFKPFDLIFKVESEEEARALYAIFNHRDNAELLGIDKAEQIKKIIGRELLWAC